MEDYKCETAALYAYAR